MVDSLRVGAFPLLILDLGDLIEVAPRRWGPVNELLIERLEREGVAAMTPGPRELAHWEEFQALLAGHALPLVNANLTQLIDGEQRPIAPRSLIVERAGLRVGLIGVLGESAFGAIQMPGGIPYTYQDPLAAIAEVLPTIRDSAEIVVVMACVGNEEGFRIARQVEGIDVVLSGYRPIPTTYAMPVGEVILNRSGSHGQSFSATRLIVSPDGEILDWGGRQIVLDVALPEDSLVVAQVGEAERAARGVLRSSTTRAPVSSQDHYLGQSVCRRCHVAESEQWSATAHAHALTTLRDEGRGGDPACVRCHVTGYGRPGGYHPGRGGGALAGVQCEACHGVGTRHVRGGDAPRITEALCRRCHTSEWSPAWGYAEALAAVRHTAPAP
ncbi:MAG: hypothetical protein KAY32_01220 [Candidatus Eisenbacteria sp.]|nr:hypothetical protein [Candidatus Eisenbacteria bacterium]